MITIKYRKVKEGRKTIDAIVSHAGFRKEISTGIKLPLGVSFTPPRSFTGGTMQQRSKMEQDLNEWEYEIRGNYTKMTAIHGTVVSKDVFSVGIKGASQGFIGDVYFDNRKTLSAFLDQTQAALASGSMTRKSNGRAFSKRSITIFNYTIGVLEKFIMKYGDFDFSKYNDDTETILGRSVVSRAYDTLCSNIKTFLVNDLNLGQYTTSNTLNITRSIIVDRADFHGLRIHKRFLEKLKFLIKSKSIVIAMSADQFEWIMKNEALIRGDFKTFKIVDYLYAGLLTAARIGDLTKLNSSNIVKNSDGVFLSYIPHKTRGSSGVRVEVPITDRLMEIFNKNMERYNGKLLPPINQARASSKLRTVLKKYEIFHNQTQCLDEHGNIVSRPFYDAFVFHSLRASLITYLLSNGEQETVAKSISGHTLDSKSFKLYANITSASKVRTMQRVAFGMNGTSN